MPESAHLVRQARRGSLRGLHLHGQARPPDQIRAVDVQLSVRKTVGDLMAPVERQRGFAYASRAVDGSDDDVHSRCVQQRGQRALFVDPVGEVTGDSRQLPRDDPFPLLGGVEMHVPVDRPGLQGLAAHLPTEIVPRRRVVSHCSLPPVSRTPICTGNPDPNQGVGGMIRDCLLLSGPGCFDEEGNLNACCDDMDLFGVNYGPEIVC